MAKGRKDSESVIASVAEWDEQAGEEVQASRKVANVGTKRSNPTLATTGGEAAVPVDLASDSGIRAKVEQARALQGQRLAPENGSVVSQKSGSTASSKPKKKRQCAEPNCEKCIAARAKHAEEAARKAARQHKLSVNTNVSPVKSREDSPVKQPHSGAIVRQKPAIHQQDSALPVPRRRDSQQAGERPVSMYDRPPPPMGGPPQSAGPYGRPDPRYPYPADPRAMMLVERSGPPMSARGGGPVGGRGRPVYNVATGALPSARRPQPSTVVVADNRPQVDNREAKMKQQLAAAQRMQQAKQPPVNEEEFSDEEEEDEEDYSDGEEEEEEDEEDYEDEESDDDIQGELLAKKMMRERMRTQSQASQDHALAMRLREAQAKQARLEDERERRQAAQAMVAEQQRRQMGHMGQMAPPPPPPPPPGHSATHMPDIPQTPGGGYSMRRALPQITYPGRRPSHHEPMDPDFRSTLRSMTPGPSGSSMNRRPSLASSGGTKATSYSGPNAYPHTTIESRTGRRMSYMGTEPRQQLENMHHGFEQTRLEQLVSTMVQNALAQNTATEEPRTVNFAMDDQLRSAMKYQNRVDHVGQHTRRDTLTDSPHIPQQLTAAALRRQAGIPSHSGSSRSHRTSDDDPSLISAGHRLTGGSETGDFAVNGDEMKVRIDTSNGFQMEFDGRLVVLNPIGDGSTAELIIGGKGARGATSYHGSQATRSVINRQPSQRQRRPAYEDDDDRTERRSVYRRDERRRDREEREAEEAEVRRRVRRERREREAAELNEAERRAAKAERKARKARKDREEAHRRQRNTRYDTTEAEDDDYTSSGTETSEDDRRTQRTVRRRAKTETEKRPKERRRGLVRNSGGYDYPAGYAQKAGFDPNPAF